MDLKTNPNSFNLIRPSKHLLSPRHRFSAAGLQMLLLCYQLLLIIAVVFVPEDTTAALAISLPLVTAAYFIARTRFFIFGGLLTTVQIWAVALVIGMNYDPDGRMAFLLLSWLTLSNFLSSTWLTRRGVAIFSSTEIAYSLLVMRLSPGINELLWLNWLFFNIFASTANYIARWMIDVYSDLNARRTDHLQKTIQQSTRRIQESLDERNELIKELYHRTKNNMQVISSLLQLQASQSQNDEVREVFTETRSRILSMALVHEKLYESKDLRYVDLSDYLGQLSFETARMYLIDPDKLDLSVSIDQVHIDISQAVPLGLVLHEMLTNSFKYASVPGERLNIHIRGEVNMQNELVMVYGDSGPGLTAQQLESSTLGMTMMHSIVEKQLEGSLNFSVGTKLDIRCIIPLETR